MIKVRFARSVCACARASPRKPSEKAVARQKALQEAALLREAPQFFEDPGFPTKQFRLHKKDVISTALSSAALYITLGCIGCVLLPTAARTLGLPFGVLSFSSVQHLPSLFDVLLALGTGLGVTALRQALLRVWPALEDSNEAANNQVLLTRPPLAPIDVFLIACVPAFAEEFAFRGALVGNIGASAVAVLIIAALFGALHVSGGRNYASGLFATAAGALYGWVYVSTGSVWAAMLSHSAGNASSAALWLRKQPRKWLALESDDEFSDSG